MRRKDREITNRDEMEAILNEALICHLGLVDLDQPYVVPVSFAYLDGCIYFHSASKGYKLDLIEKNSKVCFEVEIATGEAIKNGEQPCDWGISLRSVIGFGRAFLVSDTEEKTRALKALVARFDDRDLPFDKHDFSVTTVVRIDITSMSGKAADK